MKNYDVQALQEKYERWHELHEQIQNTQEKWLEANALLLELQEYYQSEQWMKDHESNLAINCANDIHAITSEDALWNALAEHREQAIRWMKLGLEVIDK
ncbi:DUF4298 domain-containing protein [Psychrobacter sp.]|uniref:DUF4298 domain-containing protein n=1 Tax=Psychrobacter sp. TaxID=56811 RepID=UPI003568A469